MAILKGIDKLRLIDMMLDFPRYKGLPDGLTMLPVPDELTIGKKKYPVPKTMEEFTSNICYGQRLFFTREEDSDFGIILRTIDGYYYPIVSVNKWDNEKALQFGKIVLTCLAKDIYPIAMHLVTLIGEMADREKALLHREPKKIERAAGIERLNIFAELTALDFLRDTMKITIPEVLLTPYDECLVRFLAAKEMADYQERYMELVTEEAKAKLNKSKHDYKHH